MNRYQRQRLVNDLRQLARKQELMYPHSKPTCLKIYDLRYQGYSTNVTSELLCDYRDFIGPEEPAEALWFGKTYNNPIGCNRRIIALGLLAAMVESGDVL